MLNLNTHALRQIGVTLAASGFIAGLLLAVGVLSGDAAGRVNLLYLLILFAFVPFAGLLLSLVFILRNSPRGGLADVLLKIPLWPRQWQREILILAQTPALKSWFFYQTQAIALGFGLGGLMALFLLLLGSDVSFVWRSTLLEARQILPVLQVLGWPWSFWDSAQPSLDLLQLTQDSRLVPVQGSDVQVFGHWWKYVFAAQCAYNLIPRSLMLLTARFWYHRQLAGARGGMPPGLRPGNTHRNIVREPGKPATVTHRVQTPYVLIDWAGAPAFCHDWLQDHFSAPQHVVAAGPTSDLQEPLNRIASIGTPVVLVKSWEPPMGELKDYLNDFAHGGLVMPMDWNESGVVPVKPAHLQEWQRFCGTLQGWCILQAEGTA